MNDSITIHLGIDGKEIARIVTRDLAKVSNLLQRQRERERERAILIDMAYRNLSKDYDENA